MGSTTVWGPPGWGPAAAIPSVGGPAERVPSPTALVPLPSSSHQPNARTALPQPSPGKAPPATGQPGPARGSGRLSLTCPARRASCTATSTHSFQGSPPPPPAAAARPSSSSSSHGFIAAAALPGAGPGSAGGPAPRRAGCPGRTHRPAGAVTARPAAPRPAQRSGTERSARRRQLGRRAGCWAPTLGEPRGRRKVGRGGGYGGEQHWGRAETVGCVGRGCGGQREGCGGQHVPRRHRRGRAPPDMAPGPPGWGRGWGRSWDWGWGRGAPVSPGMRRSSRAPRPSDPSGAPLSLCPQGRLTKRGARLSVFPGLWGKNWRLASAMSGMKGKKCGKSDPGSRRASSGFKQQLFSAWEFKRVVRNTWPFLFFPCLRVSFWICQG